MTPFERHVEQNAYCRFRFCVVRERAMGCPSGRGP
jgi:hypothetical protein